MFTVGYVHRLFKREPNRNTSTNARTPTCTWYDQEPATTLRVQSDLDNLTSYWGFYQLQASAESDRPSEHDRPVYKHVSTEFYIYYRTGRWMIGPNRREDIYWLYVKDNSILPQNITGTWRDVFDRRTAVYLSKSELFHPDASTETVTKEVIIRQLAEDNNNIRAELGKLKQLHYGHRYTNPVSPIGYLAGKAVIFNNINFDDASWYRKGAEGDSEKMKRVLERVLGLWVEVHENKTGSQITHLMKEQANADYTNDGCFVCVVMSHGEHGMVCGTDGTYVDIKRGLVEPVSSSKCRSLSGKPKVFIIQACQGHNEQAGKRISDANPSYPNLGAFVSNEADVFIGLATAPGYVAQRDENEGALYINKLVEVLNREGQKQDLATMMTEVNDEMNKKCKNVSSFFSTQRKKLFFVQPQ